MKNYHRLTLNERVKIEEFRKLKYSVSKIAKKLNRSKSTVSRELKRNRYAHSSYLADHANRKAFCRVLVKKDGKDKISSNPLLQQFILQKLKLRWSPQQISVTLKTLFPNQKNMNVSNETIYLYFYVHAKKELKAELISQLRQKRKKRGNFKTPATAQPKIADRVSIDERPEEVLGREIPGHWEGDLVLGKNRESAIGTLNERTSRMVIIVPLKNRDSKSVRIAFEKAFKTIPKHMKKTLTYDNGT